MKYISLILFFFIGFWGCQKVVRPSRPVVVTSVFPIYDLARQVVDESVELYYLVPAGANPHTYEMPPAQVRLVNQATSFIGVHPEFDGWIERFLPPSAKINYLMHDNEEDSLDDGHATEHHNVHIWLSISHAKKIVNDIVIIMSKVKNLHVYQDQFKKNAAQYNARLDSLDHQIQAQFKLFQNRKFIQWHPAWNYFADDYHLTIMGTVQSGHGQDTSIKSFYHLIKQARQEQVQIVVAGLNQQHSTIQSLINEINGTLVSLDTMGEPNNPERNSYIKLMQFNAKQLANALQGL